MLGTMGQWTTTTTTIEHSIKTKPIIFFFIVFLTAATVATVGVLLSSTRTVLMERNVSQPIIIPFILIPRDGQKDPFKILFKSIEKYRSEVSQALKGLSHHLEQAMALEEETRIPKHARLSQKLNKRIQVLSKCYDEDEKTLQQLIRPFPTVISLPFKPLRVRKLIVNSDGDEKQENELLTGDDDDDDDIPTNNPSTIFHQRKRSPKKIFMEENTYDSAVQIVAHVVRDWTSHGKNIRKSLYDWCCNELVERRTMSSSGPILVPGAGVGRLAYDIYSHGFTVEANELSPVMSSVANAILQQNISGTFHPFVLDRMQNEVDSERRYDSAEFPDTVIKSSSSSSSSSSTSLSFTIGDFVGDYYWDRQSEFASIVTCFFIDTATNIYEYIELIKTLLKPNGLWINVGPVQWHGNALLQPSVNELKELIVSFGFEIVLWKVDSIPVPYRQDDPFFVRYTSFEAYRPLRFVAIRQKD